MAQPSFGHTAVSSSLLVTFSALTLLPSLLVSAFVCWASGRGKVRELKSTEGKGKQLTALVNGGRMQKAIFVTRALKEGGYRVVLVEEAGWGELCAARFSQSVDKFALVPAGGGKAYMDGMLSLLLHEDVDFFVPCSGAATTLEDAKVAEIIREKNKGEVDALIQHPALVEALHEKDRFIELVHSLELDAPSSHLVRSPDEAMELFKQPRQSHMILKAANVLDDVGRSDLTTYPLQNGSGSADWEQTERRLRTGLSIPMTAKTPYIAQEFIGGEGASEWCTHATVRDGKVAAFVCCPSNDMLMTYHNATHSPVGRRALRWTQTFLDRLAKHPLGKVGRLSGQFSMDFIFQPDSDRLVVIECNPRVHTAVGLLSGGNQADERLAGALDGSRQASEPLLPAIGGSAMSWWGYDLFARAIPSILPLSNWILPNMHPLWRKGDSLGTHPSYNLEAIGKDAAWDSRDPLVFLALYHIQIPFLLLRQIFVRRRAYSRINISTARVFEC